MHPFRARTIPVLLIAAATLVTGAASADAAVVARSTLYRGGHAVGRVAGIVTYAPNGMAVSNARVTGFTAPAADAGWRTRTTISSGCIDPGFDPSQESIDGFHYTQYTVSSRWRTTHLEGTTGSLSTTDLIHACPGTQEPFGSTVISVTVQNAGGTAVVGRTTLWAAG